MELKTFRAFSMAEALAAVKQQLGHDAVILSTRTFKRGGLLGIGRKTIIEVIATPATRTPDRSLVEATRTSPARGDARAPLARRAYGGVAAKDDPLKNDRERTRRLALALAEMHQREQADPATRDRTPPARAKVPTVTPPTVTAPGPAQPPRETRQAATTGATVATPIIETRRSASRTMSSAATSAGGGGGGGESRRFILKSADADREPAGVGVASTRTAIARAKDASHAGAVPRSASDSHGRKGPPPNENISLMQSELCAIKDLVGQVLQRQVSSASGRPVQPAMPQKLFDMYLKLLSQELSEELADSIINRVRDELTTEQIEDENLVRATVMRHLAQYIPTAEQAITTASPDGRPLTIALIGPTGVGKTTTLAKIAATFKLHQRKHVGLITADTYRIAAVDQLRTYANIIGLPLKVTLTPAEMRQAVHALSDCDVILIDTAGRSQNDAGRLDELKQFITAADPHEVHLVLSSTASEKCMLQEAEAFAEVGVDKVVLTKLDEAVSFGMLVNVLRHVGKKLSFVTTGQEVPDHIECGRPDRLASMILEGKLAS